MTEPNASENKTSVVDDFFSALFANTSETSNISNNNSSDNSASSSRDATATPIPTNSTSHDIEIKREAPEDAEEEPHVENDDQQGNHSQANEQQATPPVLDEFDEYSLLSRRRQSDSTSNLNNRTRPDAEQPAQTLAKRHIDWSKVIPESRMLIHQLPKSTSKQELMDYFSKYGEVLEVVQKNTFGFVHFENPEQCARAVEAENYKTFNDVLLNLEICKRKPKFARMTENENRRRTQGHRGNNRHDTSRSRSRSRSPPAAPPAPAPAPPARNYNSNNNNNNYANNNNNNNSNKRRNSDTRNGREPKVMNDYRNRQYNGISNRHDAGFDYERTNNYRPDYNRVNDDSNNVSDLDDDHGRENNYRPDYARRNANKNNNNGKRVDPRASGYSYKSPAIVLRNGGEVPAVQIISWNTDNALMNYTDTLFKQKHIRTDTRVFNYLNHSRGALVKQMVLEGVKAIVLIDGRNSEQGKVYLQVFAPVDHGDGVRYDEYDSVTPNEAVSIVQNTHPELRQAKPRYQPYTSQYNNNNSNSNNTRRDNYNTKPQYNTASQYNTGPSYGRSSVAAFTNTNAYQKPSYYSNATRGPQYASPPVQQQQRYQPQPNYVTQSTYQQPQAISAPPAPPPPVTNIDPNTLATIYSLIQSDTLSKITPSAVSMPPTTATPAVAATATTGQPSIPQLLATLVNSLGAASMAQHTPPSAPAPLPAATTTTPEQPSMAALLSTATGGNPALAQLLLQQMTSGVTNGSSPTPPNAQTSPTLVSQTNQPQQDYGYSSYGHQRN